MAKELIDYNPLTGEYSEFHYDSATDQISIVNGQDLTAIIDKNKELLAEPRRRHLGSDGLGRRVANIPNLVLFELMKATAHMDKDDRNRYMRRWLNDPENRYYRTTNETV